MIEFPEPKFGRIQRLRSETTLQREEDEPGKRGLRSNGRTIPFGGWGFQWQFLGYRPSNVQLVSKRLWWALGCFLPSCSFTGSDALRRSKYTGRHPTQVREGGLERNECGGSALTPPPLSLRVRLSFRSIVFLVCLCKPIADGCFAALLRCLTGSPLSSEPDRTEGSSDGECSLFLCRLPFLFAPYRRRRNGSWVTDARFLGCR